MTQGFIRSAQATATARPAATEPVKATACVRSEAISAFAVSAPPGRQATRPCRQRPEHLHVFERRERRRFGRLDDAGVARGERSRDRPAHQEDREIVRQDVDAHAVGLVARILERARLSRAGDLSRLIARHLGVVAKNAGAIGDLADRLRIGLSHLPHHQLGAPREVGRLDGVRDRVEMLRAGFCVEAFPCRLRGIRRGQRSVDLGIGCGGDEPTVSSVAGSTMARAAPAIGEKSGLTK